MAARFFQVTYEPKGYVGTGIEETVELIALNKEDAINIVRESFRVGEIVHATSQQDEFIQAKYCALFALPDEDSSDF